MRCRLRKGSCETLTLFHPHGSSFAVAFWLLKATLRLPGLARSRSPALGPLHPTERRAKSSSAQGQTCQQGQREGGSAGCKAPRGCVSRQDADGDPHASAGLTHQRGGGALGPHLVAAAAPAGRGPAERACCGGARGARPGRALQPPSFHSRRPRPRRARPPVRAPEIGGGCHVGGHVPRRAPSKRKWGLV